MMEYIPTQWVDDSAPAINATNLNHIERGIQTVTGMTSSLSSQVTTLEGKLDSHLEHPEGATATTLGSVRVEVVDNGDGTFTGKIYTNES